MTFHVHLKINFPIKYIIYFINCKVKCIIYQSPASGRIKGDSRISGMVADRIYGNSSRFWVGSRVNFENCELGRFLSVN